VHNDPGVFNPSRFPVSGYSLFIFLLAILLNGQEKGKFDFEIFNVYKSQDKLFQQILQAESKPYSFLAFGMGGRACLGKNMAKAMMLVFLHRFITNCKWVLSISDQTH